MNDFSIQSNIDLFIDFLNEKNLSQNSINAYIGDIKLFLDWANNEIYDDILINYIEYCQSKNLSETTLNRKIISITQWFKFQNEELNFKINYNIPKIKNQRKNLNVINDEKIDSIIKQLDYHDSFFNIRIKAIILMLYSTGLRISEMISIQFNQIKDILSNKSKSFTIVGKGNKERKVFMNNKAVESLNIYIYVRNQYNVKSQYLWNSINLRKDDLHKKINMDNFPDLGKLYENTMNLKNFCNESFDLHLKSDLLKKQNSTKEKCDSNDKHITRQSVFLWFQKLDISPHDFRHKLASDLVNKGMNLLEVKKIMGHESIKTTSIYTHVENAEIKIKKYHPLQLRKKSIKENQ